MRAKLPGSVTYQQLFMNGINSIIWNLIGPIEQVSIQAINAAEWFKTDNSAVPQPQAVNDCMRPLITTETIFPAMYAPKGNWHHWSSRLNENLSGATDVAVREWLDRTTGAHKRGTDPDSVPPDVVDWTKKNLPLGLPTKGDHKRKAKAATAKPRRAAKTGKKPTARSAAGRAR